MKKFDVEKMIEKMKERKNCTEKAIKEIYEMIYFLNEKMDFSGLEFESTGIDCDLDYMQNGNFYQYNSKSEFYEGYSQLRLVIHKNQLMLALIKAEGFFDVEILKNEINFISIFDINTAFNEFFDYLMQLDKEVKFVYKIKE